MQLIVRWKHNVIDLVFFEITTCFNIGNGAINISNLPLQIDHGMRPLLKIVANIVDRSRHGPIATNRAIQKSYDPV